MLEIPEALDEAKIWHCFLGFGPRLFQAWAGIGIPALCDILTDSVLAADRLHPCLPIQPLAEFPRFEWGSSCMLGGV